MKFWLKEMALWFMTECLRVLKNCRSSCSMRFSLHLVEIQSVTVSVFCSQWWFYFPESYSFGQVTAFHAKQTFAYIYLIDWQINEARLNSAEIHNLLQVVAPKMLRGFTNKMEKINKTDKSMSAKLWQKWVSMQSSYKKCAVNKKLFFLCCLQLHVAK